jgi:hypothetical protein
MNATHPAAGTAFAAFEVRDAPLDMLLPDLGSLDRFNPANPFVARQGRDVFPLRQTRFVSAKGLLQVGRQFVNHALGNTLLAHAGILQIPAPSNRALRMGDSCSCPRIRSDRAK